MRVVVAQGAIVLVCSLILLTISVHEALSALAAGLICVAANGAYVFGLVRTLNPQGLLVMWVGRSLLMALLMGATFVWWSPSALGFFGAFVLAQAAFVWPGSESFDRKK